MPFRMRSTPRITSGWRQRSTIHTYALWNGVFTQIDTPEEFAEISRRGQSRLEAEGWHHTDTAVMEVVQQGPDKAHCALQNHRTHADGTVYHKFDTFWIITNQDGHWGVKFRSSFLASPSH